MSIDTSERRRSASQLITGLFGPGVTPNATQDIEWRHQSGWGYSGIAGVVPVVTLPDGKGIGQIKQAGQSGRIAIIPQGNTLDFFFDRDGADLKGWVLTLQVRRFASDTADISRVITLDDTRQEWRGRLTSTDTAALEIGHYRLVGRMVNATRDEREDVILRFHITRPWT